MVSRVAVADNRGGWPAGGIGRHGLRPDSIAKFGWADPVRRAGREAIQSLLVNTLGALHEAPAPAASPCRKCAPARPATSPGLSQNVTCSETNSNERQRVAIDAKAWGNTITRGFMGISVAACKFLVSSDFWATCSQTVATGRS